MTPDFLAGLFIGFFAIYACWLLSLRLAEPEDRLRTLDFPGKAPDLSLTADPVLAALLVLGEELDDA